MYEYRIVWYGDIEETNCMYKEWEPIFSHKKISNDEFQDIVDKALNDPEREELPLEGLCGSIVRYIEENYEDFFTIHCFGSYGIVEI